MYVCTYGFCNLWMCVCVGVLVICVLEFTVFLYCFFYVYSFLFVTGEGLLPQSENSIAVNNNNNNKCNDALFIIKICTVTYFREEVNEAENLNVHKMDEYEGLIETGFHITEI